MDVWSGRTATCVRASPPLAIETGDNFAITFFESKEQAPPPLPRQVPPYSVDTTTTGAVPKTATPCKVCGDKASGYHYGVTSCEGCKGFFRRSIQKQIEYRCLRDGKCLVIRLNRNRCQFCRFKKCLAVGMSKDSVRYGRVPKRPREPVAVESQLEPKRPTPATATLPPLDPMEPIGLRQDMATELVKLVTAAHRATNAYTAELKATLQQRDIVIRVEDSEGEGSGGEDAASSTTDGATDVRSLLWHNMALRMNPAIQQVVEFAKRLPGFHSLPQDDQLILIKLGFYEVWLTCVSRLSSPEHIVFEDGTSFTHQQLMITYDPTFATALLSYVWNIIRMQVTDEEMAMYTGTLLLCPHRPGLTAVDRITSLHNAMNDALQTYMMGNNSPESIAIARARYEAFAAARNEVRLLGNRHNDLLTWPREHWPRLLLPALFSEIFDIQKYDEDENREATARAAASTLGAGGPGASGASNSPGTSGCSGTSGSPGTSGCSPGTSSSPGTSGTSGAYGAPGISRSPGTSGTSGAYGAPGISSSPGTSGTSGAYGAPGISRSPGTSGTSGAYGAPGISRSPGTSGTSGAYGAPGISRSPGTSGTSGAYGAPGISRSPGTSGTLGAYGAPGISSSPGTSSTSGAYGAPGISGAPGSSGASGTLSSPGFSGSSVSPSGSGASSAPDTSGASSSSFPSGASTSNMN